MRNPGRTASTAAALMIGVTLVTVLSVVGQGLRDSTSGTLGKRIQATHVVTGADGWSPLDQKVERDLAKAPGVEGVTGVRQDTGLAYGGKEVVNGIDPATIEGRFSYEGKEGSDAVP